MFIFPFSHQFKYDFQRQHFVLRYKKSNNVFLHSFRLWNWSRLKKILIFFYFDMLRYHFLWPWKRILQYTLLFLRQKKKNASKKTEQHKKKEEKKSWTDMAPGCHPITRINFVWINLIAEIHAFVRAKANIWPQNLKERDIVAGRFRIWN